MLCGACSISDMTSYEIETPDLPSGQTALIEIGGHAILLCRGTSGVHAVESFCPHQHKSLVGGRVRGDTIMCPHHGARFALADGKSLSPLTARPLRVYPVREGDGNLTIDF